MSSLLPRLFTARSIAAGVFLLVMLGLIGTTLVREPLASKSPALRSRLFLATVLAKGRNLERFEKSARDLAYRDPLQAASFVLIGLKRIGQDNAAFDQVQPLMREALVRQPSFETPQIWLAADFARRGDYKRSLAHFDRALTQGDDYAPQLMPALGYLVRQPSSRAAVIERLQRYPRWRTAFLSTAIAANALPEEALLTMLADPIPPRHRATVQLERMQFISALVARGELERAHALYRGYVGINPRMPLYDGEFREAKPFSPFGWTLANQAEDYAERVAQPNAGWMVRLHSSGKHPAILLEQTLALPPGRWTVQLIARDAGLANPRQMQLAVECLAGETQLGSQTLANLQNNNSTIALNFAVAAGCKMQRLSIKAGENDGSASEIEVISLKVLSS